MYIDYIRVYQRDDVKEGVGCSPSHHPTTDYINAYAVAFICATTIADSMLQARERVQ
jgi:hypothetical protein